MRRVYKEKKPEYRTHDPIPYKREKNNNYYEYTNSDD